MPTVVLTEETKQRLTKYAGQLQMKRKGLVTFNAAVSQLLDDSEQVEAGIVEVKPK